MFRQPFNGMRLILARHGETIENREGILQGHSIGTLSRKGKAQIKKLALRLKGEKIDAIYSSDLKRAMDTAKEIAMLHPGVPLEFAEELRETDVGSLEGKKDLEWALGNRPKEFESLESMRKRAKKILAKAHKGHPNGTVLFVSHAGINKMLARVILDISMDKELVEQPNAAISIFEIVKGKKPKVLLENSTKHLE